MNDPVYLIACCLLILGAVFVLIGLLGVFRMPDFFTRLHAASIIDSMGTLLIMLGLMLMSGINLITVKLFLILLFILITTPTAAHALAKSALHGKLKPKLGDDKS